MSGFPTPLTAAEPSASRHERLPMTAAAKQQTANAGQGAGGAATIPVTYRAMLERLTLLRGMLRRLIAEAMAAREVSFEKATALSDAVCDLRVLIARLESEVREARASRQ